MIEVKKSPTADTRTCDYASVSKQELLKSSKLHISDIQQGAIFLSIKMLESAAAHDSDKISDIDGFYEDFSTGFKKTEWWDKHRRVNRHHLTAEDGVRDDVNLIDVLDYIIDCVMAGMARSGYVYDVVLPEEILQKAFNNTVKMLKENVKVFE